MVPRAVRRPSIAFLPIAAAFFAAVDTAAQEVAGSRCSTATSALSVCGFGVASTTRLVRQDSISANFRRPGTARDAQLGRSLSVVRVSPPRVCTAVLWWRSDERLSAVFPLLVAPGGPRPDGRSTLRPGRRSRLRFDAEEWDDRCEGDDDDTELPTEASLRGAVRCLHHLIPVQADCRPVGTATPSPRLSSRQPLRC
jgi:hypothetical protein